MIVAKIRISAFKVPVVYDKVLDAVPKVHQAGWSPSTNGISLDGDGPQKPLPSDPNEETDNPADYAVPPTPASGYDFILHVGVAGKGNMRVEKQADKLGYKSPDVEQKFAEIVDWEEVEVPKEGEDGENKEKEKVRVPVRGFGKGYEAFEKELKTGLDLTQLVQHLHESGIMVGNPVHSRRCLVLISYAFARRSEYQMILGDFSVVSSFMPRWRKL